MKEILKKAFLGFELNQDEISYVVDLINSDNFSKVQLAALIGAILAKKGGISANELAQFAKCIKKTSKKFDLKNSKGLMDVCGTGGDCLNTFNISTAVSFVVASCGAKVVKHGARSVSGSCGSADVLEELGVKIDIENKNIQTAIDKTNMVFLYAPNFNKTMAKIKEIRNELQAPTFFNLLGPLVNPAILDYQVIGVYDETKCELMCNTLKYLNVTEAMVVHSDDGLDELSITSNNTIWHLKNGTVNKISLRLSDLGLNKASIEDILGGDSKKNSKIILDILNGKKGPKRDIVLLNAAAALVVCGIAYDFKDGIKKAGEAIDSKKALNVLERLKNVSG